MGEVRIIYDRTSIFLVLLVYQFNSICFFVILLRHNAQTITFPLLAVGEVIVRFLFKCQVCARFVSNACIGVRV